MNGEFGNDFITLEDEEGVEFELEYLNTIKYGNEIYKAFLPADGNEDDPDYGIIILKTIYENDEEILASVDDDDELNAVYAFYMSELFEDDAEE